MDLKCVTKISAIHGKSTTGAFKNAMVGDKIIFTCPMTKAGRRNDSGGYGTTYAKYINIFNERTGGESNLTFNQIERVLKNIEFDEEQNAAI